MKTTHTPSLYATPWAARQNYRDASILDAQSAWIATTGDVQTAHLIAAAPDLLAALEDVELRCTQARIASTIGKKKDRSDFLRGELERIAISARAAIAKARGE